MAAWLSQLQRHIDANESCVLITVAGARGSVPRDVGSKMIVGQSYTTGSIGGGQLEYRCTKFAVEWLKKLSEPGQRSILQRITLGAGCGQCCGGVVEILFEEIRPQLSGWVPRLAAVLQDEKRAVVVTARETLERSSKLIVSQRGVELTDDIAVADHSVAPLAKQFLHRDAVAEQRNVKSSTDHMQRILIEPVSDAGAEIVLFGAGHVAAACVNVLSSLDTLLHVVDSRENLLRGPWPENVQTYMRSNVADFVAQINSGAYCLVMTHDHELDLRICANLLVRDDLPFIGLIGSQSKCRRFEKRLQTLDFEDRIISRLTCPIGFDDISGKEPATIAVGVAGQYLQWRSRACIESQVDIRRSNLSAVFTETR